MERERELPCEFPLRERKNTGETERGRMERGCMGVLYFSNLLRAFRCRRSTWMRVASVCVCGEGGGAFNCCQER